MVNLHHVYMTYGRNRHVLKNVDLHIGKQELVFLTGASGAGKTTLFKIITGFASATSGSVKVNNFNLNSLPSYKVPKFRRSIGVVYQDFKLLRDRTVFENVALPMQIMGRHRWAVQEEVTMILEKLGMSHLHREYPDCLSGGEKQRVAIARALIHRPPVLVADEPTGNLDRQLSREIMNLFKNANSKGTTIIIATHDRELVAETDNKRVLEINQGQITEIRDREAWAQVYRPSTEIGANIL